MKPWNSGSRYRIDADDRAPDGKWGAVPGKSVGRSTAFHERRRCGPFGGII